MDKSQQIQETIQLEAELEAYKRKVGTAFRLTELGEDAHDITKVAEKIRLELIENVGHCIASVTELARDGKSEQVRLSASKFVIERLLGTGTIDGKEQTMEQFLKSLQAPGGTGRPGESPHE